MNDSQRQYLIQEISRLSVRTEPAPTIKLASGKLSNYYINVRSAMMDPDCAVAISEGLIDLYDHLIDTVLPWNARVDYLGGVATAGIPVVQSMLVTAHYKRLNFSSGLIIRTQAKDHGNYSLIEGLPAGQNLTGKEVIIVEDAITTGGSVLKAADAVRAEGGIPLAVLAVVDRGQDTEAVFKSHGLAFAALFKGEDFLPPGFTVQMIDPPAA